MLPQVLQDAETRWQHGLASTKDDVAMAQALERRGAQERRQEKGYAEGALLSESFYGPNYTAPFRSIVPVRSRDVEI